MVCRDGGESERTGRGCEGKGDVYIFCALSVHHEELGAVEVRFGFVAALCPAEVFLFDAVERVLDMMG
jgi:hypothetical protein